MKIEPNGSRRSFIKNAAIFAGLAVFFGRGDRPAVGTSAKPPDTEAQVSQGYRLTDHVKKYYETARL